MILATWDQSKDANSSVTAVLYDNGDLVFSGQGDVKAITSFSGGSWAKGAYSGKVKTVRFEEGVRPTSLDMYFINCYNLTTVYNIPDSVASMRQTFQSCDSLTESPVIPDSVTDMYRTFTLSGLVSAPQIPRSVTNLEGTFDMCESLISSPDIEANVTEMRLTFSACTSLVSTPKLPDSVVSMESTFSDCENLKEVTSFPSSLESMKSTFGYCSSLVSVPKIPDGVTDMTQAFSHCTSLTTAPAIPSGVTKMNSAFEGCTSLTAAVILPSGASQLSATFADCPSLTSLPAGFRIPETLGERSNLFGWESLDVTELEGPIVTMCAPADYDALVNAYEWEDSFRTLVASTDIGTATVSGIEPQLYTGSAITPKVTVLYDGVPLVEGVDYTLAYSNNTSVGTGQITITGMGDYSGTRVVSFGIVSASTSDLSAAIAVAQAAKSGVVVSADGSGVAPGMAWVPQAAMDALDAAIKEAQDAVNRTPATSADVARWTSTLNSAVETFEAAKTEVPALPSNTFTITYYLNGGVNASDNPLTYESEKGAQLADPTREGFTFGGWFSDAAFTQKVDNIAPGSTGNLSLWAKWDAPATVTFADVDESAWYAPSVKLVADKGLMRGYGDTGLFGVGMSLTRAEFAVILWRYADPASEASYVAAGTANSTGMSDVEAGAWYTGAANWAVKNGYINGFGGEDGSRSFAPHDPVSFEQMVTILANMLASNGDISQNGAAGAALGQFVDGGDVSSWAAPSMTWAVEKTLVNGYGLSDGRYLQPFENVARERIATVIANAFEINLMK